MTNRRPEVLERLGAMLIDNTLMTLISLLVAVPSMIDAIIKVSKHGDDAAAATSFAFWSSPAWYFALVGFALYFWKDSFDGRSIGKRLMYYQIVNNKTGLAADPIRCVLRNVTFVIWPVEVIMAIINPSRRLGDMLAGTRVELYDNKAERQPTPWLSLIISFLLAYGMVVILSLPLVQAQKKLNKPAAMPYIKSSYNNGESQQLNAEIDDKVGEYVESTIRVFDKNDRDSTKYISCEFKWIGSYDDNADARDSLCQIMEGIIQQEYPYGTYKGEAKFIYPKDSYRSPVRVPLGVTPPDEPIDTEDIIIRGKGSAKKDSVYVL